MAHRIRLISALLALAALSAPGLDAREAAGQTAAPRLAAGARLEGTIKGGEVHAFAIELEAGTLLRVRFDQQGADIRPVIFAPDGTKIYDLDKGEWGMEPASVIAAAPGLYRLEAQVADKAAPAGRYVLYVDSVRPATAEDEAVWRIVRLQVQGFAALQSRDRAGFERGRDLYQQVLDGARSLGERTREAEALTALAFIANWLDDFTGAVRYTTDDLALRLELGDEYGEARSLYGLGIALRVQGEAARAEASFQQALALHRAAGRHVNESDLLAALATSARLAGDYGAALEYAYDAVTLARRMGNRAREADALLAAAPNHLDLGEFEVAIGLFDRARLLAPDDVRVAGICAAQLGFARLRLGELDAAQRLLDEALAIWAKRQWGGYLAITWRYYGQLHLARGDPERAHEAFEHAAEVAAKIGFAAGESTALRESGEALLDLGRLDEAERAFGAAMARLARPPDPLQESALISDSARLALARGDLAQAHARADEAARLVESVRGRAESARVRTGLLASSHGVYEVFVDVLMAEHEASPTAAFDRQAFEVSERARARSLLEQISVDRLGSFRTADTPSAALESVQRRLNARAQALEDARRTGRRSLEPPILRELDELVNEFAVTEARIRRDAPGAMAVTAPDAASAETVQQLLDPGTVLVEYLLGARHGYAWTVSREAITSYRLEGRDALASAAREVRAAFAAAPAAITAASRLATERASRLLLVPLASVPSGARIVIVAPGELQQVPWAALPHGRAGSPLIARHELVLAPSASIIAALRHPAAGRATAARRAALVFADPVFDRDDPRVLRVSSSTPATAGAADALRSGLEPVSLDRSAIPGGNAPRRLSRLPFTRLEADAIAALAPRGAVRSATGFDASLQAVTDPGMAGYRVVHFATHGVLDTRTPQLSGLVLSLVDRQGRPQNGFLRLHDLDRLHLDAELTVLSGCETALGRTVEGEGVIGLTRGFLAAGSRRVVASVWKVDDLATAELMRRFYAGMFTRGQPAAAALRAAQLEMARSARWGHPHYWAGWVLNGDWR